MHNATVDDSHVAINQIFFGKNSKHETVVMAGTITVGGGGSCTVGGIKIMSKYGRVTTGRLTKREDGTIVYATNAGEEYYSETDENGKITIKAYHD